MNYPILVTEPTTIEAGKALVSFRRKSTTKQPVADGDKYRAVVVPAFSLPIAIMADSSTTDMNLSPAADDVFIEAITEAFFAAAGEILRAFCDGSKDAKEIPADLLTFQAVVTKMQETQTSQRLNAEQIATWYDQSATSAAAATRYTDATKGPKQQAALKAKFMSLASNNPGIDVALATKMLSYVSEADTSHSTCKAVLKKLERLTKETIDADEL